MSATSESIPDEGAYHVIEQDTVPSAALQPPSSKQKEVEAIQRWLQPTDYRSPGNEYMKHLHAYVPGTGSWVRESPTFRAWTLSATSPTQTSTEDGSCQTAQSVGLLHVRGVAGSGKSVFAASTIRQLQEAEPNAPVLFFFFRQIVDKNHSAKYLVRDFASQLLQLNDELFTKRLTELSKRGGVDGSEMDTLWTEVVQGLSSTPKAYCVVDALDEMDDEDFAVIERLIELGTTCPDRIKVMLTSRPIPRIEETLRRADGRMSRLKLEPSLIYPDIAKYVDVRLLSLNPLLKPETEDRVKKTICERSQGLFLHARLMTDNLTEGLLSGRLTEDILPDALERLPRSLKNVYQEMLQETARRNGIDMERQASILMWVTCSSRPLRLIELGALTVDLLRQEPALGSGSERTEILKQGKDLVRASCGRLLEILEDETVSVIHHSFTEFLHDTSRRDEGPDSFPVLEPKRAHSELAVSLLKYLDGCPLLDMNMDKSEDDHCDYDDSYDEYDDYRDYSMGRELRRREKVLKEAQLTHPSLLYAADNLVHHVGNADLVDCKVRILGALEASFVPGKPAYGVWMYRNWKLRLCSSFNILHLAVVADMPLDAIKHIAPSSPSRTSILDVLDGNGQSPFSYAAEFGHTEVAQHLLDCGFEYESTDRVGYSPLHYAAMNGHLGIAKSLLHLGVSPLGLETEDSDGEDDLFNSSRRHTPLNYACKGGHSDIMAMMLPLAPPSNVSWCLHWAWKPEDLETILSTGRANVNCLVGGATRLFKAVAGHNADVVRVLLRHGADPNKRCSKYASSCATEDDNIRDDEEDPSRENPHGAMPIHAFACCETSRRTSISNDEDAEKAEECLRLLVEGGADINAVYTPQFSSFQYGDEGLTPLFEAVAGELGRGYTYGSNGGQTEMRLASILLANGADPRATTKFGDTPAHYANPAKPALFEMLFKHGADMNAKNRKGMTPLLSVVANHQAKPKPEVFEVLIKCGADVTAADNRGDTVFHHIFRKLGEFKPDSIPSFQLLLASGADLAKQNNAGEPPLHVWKPCDFVWNRSDSSEEQVLQELIGAGLDMNVRDKHGRTILWHVFGLHSVEISDSDRFVRLGADIKCVATDSGSTLLHRALERCHGINLVNQLVARGVDPSIRDAEGNTLLLSALKANASLGYYQTEDPRALFDRVIELDNSPAEANKKQRTTLHYASLCRRQCEPRKYHAIGYILGNQAFSPRTVINARDEDGATPLHYAASTSEGNVAMLLEAGADPTAVTTQGVSPLHIACYARQPNIVGLLIDTYKKRGTLSQMVNLHHSSDKKRTSLHLAVRAGLPESVDYLLANGAAANCADASGLTPLHVLAEIEEERAMWNDARGIERRAMVQLDSKWRPQRESFAVKYFFDEAGILDLLLDAGGDFHAVAKVEEDVDVTPLDIALRMECHDAVRELSAKGATTRQQDQKWQPKEEVARARFAHPYSDKDKREIVNLLTEAVEQNDSATVAQYTGQGWKGTLIRRWMGEIIDEMIDLGRVSMLKRFKDQAVQVQKDLYNEDDNYGSTLMERACQRERSGIRILRLLLETFDLDVNAQSTPRSGGERKLGPTALHVAAAGKWFWHVEAVEYLLSRGADLEIKDEEGETPLLYAIHKGPLKNPAWLWRERTVQTLLEHGADPNATAPNGTSCLDRADTANILKLLIKHGADVTAASRSFRAAVEFADSDMLRVLLAAGADPNYLDEAAFWDVPTMEEQDRDDSGMFSQKRYALHEAARRSCPSERAAVTGPEWDVQRERVIQLLLDIQLLLENGADPLKHYPDGNSVIHGILQDKGLVAVALEHGKDLDVEMRGAHGRTLLHSACLPTKTLLAGREYYPSEIEKIPDIIHAEAVHALLERGADCTATDDQGRTPLHYCCSAEYPFDKEQEEAFKSLVDRDPSVIHVVDKKGLKPLQVALESDQWKAVRYLVEKGADLHEPDPEGNIVLHFLARKIVGNRLAAKEARADFQQFLSVGLDVNARNKKGETAALICMMTSWEETRNGVSGGDALDTLIKTGADLSIEDYEKRTLMHVLAGRRPSNNWRYSSDETTYVEAVFKKLMDLGLDPRKEDAGMRTAIDLAVINGWTGIVDLFGVKEEEEEEEEE